MKPAGSRVQQTARAGEEAVAQWLLDRGYRIVHRNLRIGRGEIDIVASKGDLTCIVEVKSRRGRSRGAGFEAVTPAKMAQIRRLGLIYAAQVPGGRFRFDVASVRFDPSGEPEVTYYENAFTETDP
jgi:putative endonuclease